jgi:trimeric autotransporter adhesin
MKTMKTVYMCIVMMMAIISPVLAQVAVNTDGSLPDASAMLDVKSASKGFLVPRMTDAERIGILSPAVGLLVYQTNGVNGYYYYNGTSWLLMSTGALPGGIAGQTLRHDGSVWAANSLLFNNGTNVGIGTTAPTFKLDVTGSDAIFNGIRVGRGGGNGSSNTAIGFEAMNVSTNTGDYNCASGYRVLRNISTGDNNTGQGYAALTSLTKGSGNTATGFKTLMYDTTGNHNTAHGYAALYFNRSGSNNTASGLRALYNNTEGYSNVAMGAHALYSSTDLSNLVAIGDSALFNNGIGATGTEGKYNTAVGSKSLYSNTTGFYNTANGYQALYSNNEGADNSATGYMTLYYNTSGDMNTACGESALLYNTTGSKNTAIGSRALLNNKANSRSTAIGFLAMYNANNTLTGINTYNTAIGYSALKGSSTIPNNTGKHNTAIGDQAVYSITSGSWNSAIGDSSLYANSSGYNNSATGYAALTKNTTGHDNTAVGNNSMNLNATGSYNTAIGSGALRDGLFVSNNHNYNTAVGYSAGFYSEFSNEIGPGCTMVGSYTTANGDSATFIGYGAGPKQLTYSSCATTNNSIGIGNNTKVSGNNQVRLGNSAIQTMYCQGAYVGTVGATCRDLYVDNTGKIGYLPAPSKYKDNVQNLDNLEWLYNLRPVSFTYKTDQNRVKQYGLIAEEVEKVNPEFVSYNQEGIPEAVSYSALVTPLLKAVQEQKKLIEQLRTEIELLKSR